MVFADLAAAVAATVAEEGSSHAPVAPARFVPDAPASLSTSGGVNPEPIPEEKATIPPDEASNSKARGE